MSDALTITVRGDDALERNVMELAAYGFTVVPPEKTGIAPDFVERLRDAILRTHGTRNDDPIDDYRTAEVERGFQNNWWTTQTTWRAKAWSCP